MKRVIIMAVVMAATESSFDPFKDPSTMFCLNALNKLMPKFQTELQKELTQSKSQAEAMKKAEKFSSFLLNECRKVAAKLDTAQLMDVLRSTMQDNDDSSLQKFLPASLNVKSILGSELSEDERTIKTFLDKIKTMSQEEMNQIFSQAFKAGYVPAGIVGNLLQILSYSQYAVYIVLFFVVALGGICFCNLTRLLLALQELPERKG